MLPQPRCGIYRHRDQFSVKELDELFVQQALEWSRGGRGAEEGEIEGVRG
jgi:hypothetical protein